MKVFSCVALGLIHFKIYIHASAQTLLLLPLYQQADRTEGSQESKGLVCMCVCVQYNRSEWDHSSLQSEDLPAVVQRAAALCLSCSRSLLISLTHVCFCSCFLLHLSALHLLTLTSHYTVSLQSGEMRGELWDCVLLRTITAANLWRKLSLGTPEGWKGEEGALAKSFFYSFFSSQTLSSR